MPSRATRVSARASGRRSRSPPAPFPREPDRGRTRRPARASRVDPRLRGTGSSRRDRPPPGGPRRRCARLAPAPQEIGAGPRGELHEVATRERRQIGSRARQRLEHGASGLVRKRYVNLAPGGQRLEQPPFGAGEILEAVREDRRAPPRAELAREPLDRPPTHHSLVPGSEALELRPVGQGQRGRARAGDPTARACPPRSP